MVCTQYSCEPTHFIIEKSSALAHQVKEMGIQEINRCASYYSQSLLHSHSIEKGEEVDQF